MAVRIAVRAIPLMRRRSEKSDDWYMDGVCDVEWTGVTGNVERRHFFKSGEFQEVRLSHKVHGIRGRRDFPDGFAHGHLAF